MNAGNARAKTASRFGDEFRPVEPLGNSHRKDNLQRDPRLLDHFDRCANTDQNSKRVFVLTLQNRTIVGWYSLVPFIAGSDAEPFPILRLADIAVADEFKGTGLFEMLRKDADRRISMLAERRMLRAFEERMTRR